jgi:hypothetical protein
MSGVCIFVRSGSIAGPALRQIGIVRHAERACCT